MRQRSIDQFVFFNEIQGGRGGQPNCPDKQSSQGLTKFAHIANSLLAVLAVTAIFLGGIYFFFSQLAEYGW